MTDFVSNLSTKAGVVFDVDGTLTDTESVWSKVEQKTLTAHGGIPEVSILTRFQGCSVPETAKIIRSYVPDPKPSLSALVDELTGRFEMALLMDPVDPMPGGLELLETLRARAIPTAAVSNSPRRVVELTLRITGLYEFVELIVCAGDDPELKPKPAPDLYTFAARGLGINPHLSWGVEDTRPGLLALRAAHFLPVAVQPDAVPERGPMLVTRTLRNLDIDWLFATAAFRKSSRS